MSTHRRKGKSMEASRAEATRQSQSEAREEAADLAKGAEASQPQTEVRSLDFTRRLRRLYEISTLLTRFESAERTVPPLVELLAQALPIRNAIFLLAEGQGKPRTIIWQAEGESADRLSMAENRARSAYRYFVRSNGDRDGDEKMALEPSTPRLKENFIALPLVVAQQPIFGVLHLEGVNPFDELDLIFVNAVTNQLAIAVDRQAVINAKQASAEAGEREQRLLADVSAVVGSSLDYRETLAALARSAVPQLADLCLFDEVGEDGSIERREVKFADDTKQRELAGRMRHLSPGSQTRVLASHHAILFGEMGDLVAAGIDQDEADALRDAEIESMMVVPLLARGQRFGVLTFAIAGSGRRYSAHELALAEELARRAAIAIDNARLYEQAQRATLDRENLLEIVSHDLKNPLAVILMNLSVMLKSREGDPTAPRPQLVAIQQSAKRMNSMLADLLETTSIEGGRLSMEQRRLDVVPLLCEALDSLQPLAASKAQRLETEFPTDLPAILADGTRMHQVLANLVGNAIKFTPEGGAITVRATPAGDKVLISIADTGPGIADDELPRIFDRFWQARPTARLGTGLGLFIVKGIVEAHGGRVWVESTVSAGSTFHFTIPVAPPDPSDQRPA